MEKLNKYIKDNPSKTYDEPCDNIKNITKMKYLN